MQYFGNRRRSLFARAHRYSGARGKPVATAAPEEASYGYELRRGAAAYAPIVGTIGGFVVTGVVLVFDIASNHRVDGHVEHASMLGRATGLLVLGLIACLLGAFALAAIGAERRLTPNLFPSALYAGVCTAIGVVAIVGAFEVLAAVFLKQTQELFALINGGTAIAGSVMVSLVLGDTWTAEGLSKTHWLSTQKKSVRAATGSAVAGALVLALAMALYFGNYRLHVGDRGLQWVVGFGIALALLSGLGSMFRTIHTEDGRGGGITKGEAIFALAVMNGYLALFLLMMP